MSSPLSPILADLYMEFPEDMTISSVTHKPLTWHRYVDDTFVAWPHGQVRKSIQVYIHELHCSYTNAMLYTSCVTQCSLTSQAEELYKHRCSLTVAEYTRQWYSLTNYKQHPTLVCRTHSCNSTLLLTWVTSIKYKILSCCTEGLHFSIFITGTLSRYKGHVLLF